MNSLLNRLRSTTAVAVVVAIGAAGTGYVFSAGGPGIPAAQAQNPCAARNPCAAKNPCGAKNPCASACVVPRLQTAALQNPCAANPCAAKANPCAAKANPCAARSNPCAAKANPCAAKANPCAAKANPCAANPCAANPCGPCGPCGAAAAVEITDAEAVAAYDCVLKEIKAAYAKSSDPVAKTYLSWKQYSKHAYQSATHGARYVQNFANAKAQAYGRYEKSGKLPPGAQLAKNSFSVAPDGSVSVGPVFIMEKMPAGFYAASGDWKYTMVMPDGSTFGQTKGANAANMEFCVACHAAAADNDHLMFLPEEYRAAGR